MTTQKHTPTPWRVGEVRHAGRYQLIYADALLSGYVAEVAAPFSGSEIDEPTREANAAFIVRAVNAHDDLVKALTDLLKLFREVDGGENEADHPEFAQADAALGKAAAP